MAYVPYVFSVTALVVGTFVFFRGFGAVRRERLLKDTPTSTARALAVGPAEIAGEAEPLPGSRLVAPFTGEPCAFASWKVEELRSTGKSSYWATVGHGKTGAFLIRDRTGATLVDADGAEIDADMTDVAKSGFAQDPSPEVQAFLAEHDIPWESWLGANKKMRYSQFVLGVGGPAYAMGTATEDARAKDLHAAGVTATDLVLTRGRRETTFLLSDSERDAEGKLSSAALGGILLGALFAVVGLGMLLHDMGAWR